MTDTAPDVRPFLHEDTGTWSYLVVDPVTRTAAVVDPVLDFDAAAGRTSHQSAQLIADAAKAAGAHVQWLLETHVHADHLSAAHWLKQGHFPNATIAIGHRIVDVQKAFRPIYNLGEHLPVDGSQFDHLFTEDAQFRIGELHARVIAVPGHTSDSVAYLIGDALFCGDSLFMPDGGTARCDFPGGDARTLFRSIQRLWQLPDETRVFVCHDYAPGGRAHACETTIGEQRARNIHVGDGIDEEAFVQMRQARDATLDMPRLILPSIQVNLRAGALPDPEDNGVRYLKLPLNALKG